MLFAVMDGGSTTTASTTDKSVGISRMDDLRACVNHKWPQG